MSAEHPAAQDRSPDAPGGSGSLRVGLWLQRSRWLRYRFLFPLVAASAVVWLVRE